MSKRNRNKAKENKEMHPPSKIEAFIRFVSDNKLLSFFYSLFVPCLFFVINFYIEAPNKWLEFEQKTRDIDYFLAESTKVDTVYGAILDVLDASLKANTAYFELIDKIKAEGEIPSDEELQKVLTVIQDNSATIIINIDLLRGLKLSDPRLSAYPGEFAENAEVMRESIEKSEQVLITLINGDTEAALKSLQEHSDAWYESNNTMLELYARSEGFSTVALKISSDQEIMIQKDTNDIKYFRIMQFLTIPAIIFLVAMVFYTIYRFNLFSRKKK